MQMLELLAAVFGLLGTILLATRSRFAGWGFVAYLVSNGGWMAFAWPLGNWWLFAQQVGFTATSLIGIWCWLVRQPQLDVDAEALARYRRACAEAEDWLACTHNGAETARWIAEVGEGKRGLDVNRLREDMWKRHGRSIAC
ncbi:hypothetical protein ACFX58_03610 [Sphingomonas sp. NCPPB 2930]